MYNLTYERTPSRRIEGIRRSPLDFAAILAALLVIGLLVGVLFWQFWHANRIFTGVNIAGVSVGGMTRAAALQAIKQNAAIDLPPVTLVYGDQQWPLPTDQLQAEVDWLSAVNQAYLVGRTGALGPRLSRQMAVAVSGIDLAPPRAFAGGQLRTAVEQLAQTVERPAEPSVEIAGVAVPGQVGLDVDVDATLTAVMDAIGAASGRSAVSAPLVITTVEPAASTVAVGPAPAAAAAPQPLLLSDAAYGLDIAIDPGAQARLLLPGDPPQVDREALRAYLDGLAAQIDIPARDARLRFDPVNGALSVIRTSQPGRKLDVDATIAAVEQAVASGSSAAALAVVEAAPAVDMNRTAEMGIRELVASGVSYYAGSSNDRVYNIEVAAEKFDGIVIPPGEIFSFNGYVEDVSSANGFEDGLVIWGDRTAVGVGGGVCQVSTTIFRAAYEAGLPIVERYNHGYVVSWYGEPGLDATIYTPTVDLKFRNDTGAYLLMQPVVDSANGVMRIDLYGTKPDRVVTVSKPKISDVQPAPAPSYVVDESLAPGQRKQVDWAQEGMTVVVERTIVENGETRTETLTSKYQPWKAVYLVGPGTEVPATPTPQAAPTEEAAAEAQTDAPAAEVNPAAP